MIIMLKLFEPLERSEKNYTKNMLYNSKQKLTRKLYPIPEFAGNDPRCSCGQPAFGMTEDFNMLCSNCAVEPLGEVEAVSKEEYKIPNIEDLFKKQRLEWSISGKDNWYTVSGRNIVPDSRRIIKPEDMEIFYHRLIKNILSGKTENIEAEYEKETKKMKVYF